MDPLSDVLRAIRLDGAYFFLAEATPPWSVSKAAARSLVPRILPGSEHLVSYHIVVQGSCFAGLDDQPRVRLEAGDVIVFPHGDPHSLSSEDHAVPERTATSEGCYPQTVHLGPPGKHETIIVCGFLGCDVSPYNPLLASLPRHLHVRGLFGGWLAEFPRQVLLESALGRIGSETMLTRMSELMFVELLRQHVEQLAPHERSWLAALRDPIVGAAITAVHERPDHAWSLAEMAKRVATSRSVLVERFSELVGIPPMQYLTQWRLQLAAQHLRSGTAKVAAVGMRVGYASEAAFSRAFKRATGQSPSEWRRTHGSSPEHSAPTSAG